jgi:hypothetical protein
MEDCGLRISDCGCEMWEKTRSQESESRKDWIETIFLAASPFHPVPASSCRA